MQTLKTARGRWIFMAALLTLPSVAAAESGVTDTEILIGSCAALEGRPSSWGPRR